MESRTLTVLITDIEGFTARTSAQTRSKTLDMVEQHQKLLLPILEVHRGRLLKTVGDSFLCVFESPTNAVLAGMHMQRVLRRHNSKVPPEEQFRVRIGINTGEVAIREDDVFGDTVNISKRIEELTPAGEVYFSESTYLAMNKTEVPFTQAGVHTLNGVPEPVKLYQAGGDSVAVRSDGGAASDARPEQKAVRYAPAPNIRRIAAFIIDLVCVAVIASAVSTNVRNGFVAQAEAIGRSCARAWTELSAVGGFIRVQLDTSAPAARSGDSDEPDTPVERLVLEVRRFPILLRDGPYSTAGGAAILAVVFLCYTAAFTALAGRTAGKTATALRVVQLPGRKPTALRSLIRSLALILAALPAGLGLLPIFFDRERRGLHDWLSRTRVVRRAQQAIELWE